MTEKSKISKQLNLTGEEEAIETRGRKKVYTKEHIDQIKQYRLEGKTFTEISKIMDIAERTIFKLLEKKKSTITKAKPIEFEGVKYYNVKDTANILKLTENTIRAWIRKGELKASKMGRGYYVSEMSIKRLLK